MPGWYPDPAGGQGRYRYWDGTSWSGYTTNNPGEPPPVGGRGDAPLQQRRARGGLAWLIIAVALVVLAAVAAWLIFSGRTQGGRFVPIPEDTNSSTPTVQGWDETTRPTPPPTDQASLVACPVTSDTTSTAQSNDGRLRGGGISVQGVKGWVDYNMYLQWVSDFHTQVDQVRPGWISNIGVGQLNAVDGFTDPRTSARQTVECFASSGYYTGFTFKVDLIDEPTTISGYPAWRIRSEVHIQSDTMPEIEGDVVDIIVVDLGDPQRMGLFISSVTIGDTRRQELVDKSMASITVG